ncbi:hypothetical protein [Streptomyces sp. NRRL S-244]|uniref:hypothetical protein n=1 Tax=Streptomyces sp. NRRL S-244 TaxID=1463897 RepID=UPI00055E9E9A|nr:hypothetical protein [Streptomyces sp. NRRL S-244]
MQFLDAARNAAADPVLSAGLGIAARLRREHELSKLRLERQEADAARKAAAEEAEAQRRAHAVEREKERAARGAGNAPPPI